MAKAAISSATVVELEKFLKKNRRADLITTYLFYLEKLRYFIILYGTKSTQEIFNFFIF